MGLLAVLAILVVALVAAPLVALVRDVGYAAANPGILTPRALVSEVYPGLATGDLLLFAAATRCITSSATNREFYSHTGLVIREGDLVYSTEATMGGYFMPEAPETGRYKPFHPLGDGAWLYPLLARLKYYPGLCFLLKLSKPLDPAREAALLAEADALTDPAKPYAYPSAWQAILSALGRPVAARHCFQHVAHLLDVAGLTPAGSARPLAEAGIVGTCREICSIPGRALGTGRWYEPPVQLVYDIA